MQNPDESSDDFVNRVMMELDEALEYLPEESLRDVQAHRELFIPRLIRCIEDACDEFEEEDIASGNAHFFALFLLTEFQAMSAWPAIRRAISLPEEGVEELFGDASTGFLCRVLSVFAAEHSECLDELIANRAIDAYVRWEAATTFMHLVRDGRLTREAASERLLGHVRAAMAPPDHPTLVTGLLLELSRYGTNLGFDEAITAFEQKLVEEQMVVLAELKQRFSNGDVSFQAALAHCDTTGIEDTVEELQKWSCFDEDDDEYDEDFDRASEDDDSPPDPEFVRMYEALLERLDEALLTGRQPTLDDFSSLVQAPEEEDYEPVETIRNTTRKVGRNESCPCGSGKKYKKCCGGA